MTDYIVSGADLTAVANEIRSKGGTSAQLEFPTEFISAIEAISGGGGAGIWATVNPFSSSTIPLYHSNGVTVESSSVVNGVGSMAVVETSAGYEGFNVQLNNLEAGKIHKLEMDIQLTSGNWHPQGYTCGFKVVDSADTNYTAYSNWPNNIIRDSNKNSYSIVFIPAGATAYLSVNLCGMSDNTTNKFAFTDITLRALNLATEVTLGTKSITQNGTYEAEDDSLDGYSSVTVNVAGGGGVPLLTQAEWSALTAAQKQAYGLVAIQKASSGFNRGLLVNGADYIDSGTYLPSSNESKVDCLAVYENFTASALSWGSGLSTIQLTSAVSQYNDEQAVFLNARSGCQPRIELPTNMSDFTMYVVAKGITYNSGDVHIMGSVGTWTTGKMVNIYHRTGTIWRSSVYGSSDTDLIDTGGDYVAVAIRSAMGSGNLLASWFAHNGSSRLNSAYSNHGDYFTFGWRDGVNSVDLAVKFVGYINEAETDAQIAANLANLATVFELS